MEWRNLKGSKDYQIFKQLIDSKLQNFDWETNPRWNKDLGEIRSMINKFWIDILERKYDFVDKKWVEKSS